MPRSWTIRGNFHTIGEVVVTVSAGSWVAALGKGARALKANEQLKGKRIKALSLTLSEIAPEAHSESQQKRLAVQGQLPTSSEQADQSETRPGNKQRAAG